jgi:phage protein D/phage baseplate assembly protein gpV
MAVQQSAGKFKIEVDGAEVPADVDNLLSSAVVDSNLHQPDLFLLSFRDSQRTVLSKTGARIGSKVKVTAFSDAALSGDPLLSGEITALEVEHDSSGTFTVLRGYDQSHLLFRGRYTETYQNMTAADIARKVAQRANLQPGQIDPTSPVFPYVAQNNSNDWSFLKKMAADVGYEVLVDDGKLHFRQPSSASAGPGTGDLTQTDDPLKLTMGAHILRLRSVVTSADQVGQVEVRGWDPTQKKALVGTAPAGTTSASVGTKPGDLANVFGSATMYGVSVPFSSQTEVDGAAKALADHIGGAFAEVEGLARGNSKLRAGVAISLSLVGDLFDGKYTLTSVRHRFEPSEGYTTAFTVSGRNQRSLLGLASSGSPGGGPGASAPPISGVVIGIVSDVNDPDQLGRVKLSFPWLPGDYNSDWARMVQVGAGNNRGASFLPEVNDEVLVAFDHGDWRLPYVIGLLHNGVDKPLLGDDLIDGTSGAVKRRGLISKHGHALLFFDDPSKDGTALMTGDHNLRISLNAGTTTVKITSSGKISIEGAQDVSIKSSAGITVEAQNDLTLKGQSVSISADSSVSISANADVTVAGNPIKLN